MSNKTIVMKVAGLALLAIGAASISLGSVPEIDPGTGVNAIALLAGALLVVRSRRS